MANKRSVKSIIIEKRILDFITTKLSGKDFTILEIVEELVEFNNFKYLNRTVWKIIKNLMNFNYIKKTYSKRNMADCYEVINITKLIERFKMLNNETMLSSKKITYKHKQQIVLTSSELGKNIIDYINSLESNLAKAHGEIIMLKRKINELSINVLSSQSGIGKTMAGEKLFVFDSSKK